MPVRRYTIYDAMEARGVFDKNPANHEYQEYPKAIRVPRKLPAKLGDPKNKDYINPEFFEDGCKHFDAGTLQLLAVVKDGKWESVPQEITAEDEDHERRLLGMLPKPKTPALKEEDDELAALRHTAAELGVTLDKRWGLDKVRAAVQKHMDSVAA